MSGKDRTNAVRGRLLAMLHPAASAIDAAVKTLAGLNVTVRELPPARCLQRRFLVDRSILMAWGLVRRAEASASALYGWPLSEMLGRDSFGPSSAAFIASLGVANPLHLDNGDTIPFAARWIVPEAGWRFRWAESNEGGAVGAIIMPWPSFDRCDDLVAFDFQGNCWRFIGIADWLGDQKAKQVRGGTEIRLFASPLTWVRGLGRGVCPIDPNRTAETAERLRKIKSIRCDDRGHAGATFAALDRARPKTPKIFYETQ